MAFIVKNKNELQLSHNPTIIKGYEAETSLENNSKSYYNTGKCCQK